MADPRCFAASSNDRYVRLAESWVASAVASQHELLPPAALVREYRDALERNADNEIGASLQRATSAAVYRCMWRCLDAATGGGAESGLAVEARAFAIPVLTVSGGRAGALVPGVLPDVHRLETVLREHGALGRADNFALAGVLCSLETLSALPPSAVYALSHASPAPTLDLPPAAIETGAGDEHVHLRFLAGAAMSPANAPSLLETASAIGLWGMAFARELAAQLRTDGVSLLPIARPPAGLLAAQPIGSHAREELALQAFVSRALRRLRTEAGEPRTEVAALDSGAVGVRFVAPFASEQAQHVRALGRGEDFDEVVTALLDLLRECQVTDVQVHPGVLPVQAFTASTGMQVEL